MWTCQWECWELAIRASESITFTRALTRGRTSCGVQKRGRTSCASGRWVTHVTVALFLLDCVHTNLRWLLSCKPTVRSPSSRWRPFLDRQDIYSSLAESRMVGHRQKVGRWDRKVSVDPLGVMKKCHTSTVEQQRERPGAKSSGIHATDKYFACTNFRELRTNREYSENLTHAKISMPMVPC